jgi:isoleucyl-tRNA synthetase
LAGKWAGIRRVRRVVTAALEIQRQDKVIGASLEAAPVVYVEDAAVVEALKTVPFDDICITSAISVSGDPALSEAFRMPEVEGVGVVFERANGEKCLRCWKILPDVGTHNHAGNCARCNEVLG